MDEETALLPTAEDQIKVLLEQEGIGMSRWGTICPVNLTQGNPTLVVLQS